MTSNDSACNGVFWGTCPSASSSYHAPLSGSARSAANVLDVPMPYDGAGVRKFMHPAPSIPRPSLLGAVQMAHELPSRSLLSRFDACAPTSPELIFCNAINDKRIDEYGEMSDSTRAYLHRNFSDFGDKWRHKRCSLQIL